MKIEIKCSGAISLPITSLVPFQNDLKSLSKENYEKLKRTILELGFSEPVTVWQHEDSNFILNNFILNGHQRVRALQMMIDEGYECPAEIPCSLVVAKNIKEAKKKLLSLTSQYGKIDDQGLYGFMTAADLIADDLKDFNFPEVDIEEFGKSFFDVNFVAGGEGDQNPLDQTSGSGSKPTITCPECGHEFNKKAIA